MFSVLRSSAGAGKTHALVKEFLARCLASDRPDAYRQVLALTFTTKAAGEMRERVMDTLRHLARGEGTGAAIQDVRDTLMRVCRIDAETLSERAGSVLSHMLHHWSDVAISTIDAFTRRLLRPFARDLELDQDLEMTTEEATYLDRAVAGLLERAGRDEQVTVLLTRACLRMLEEEQKWRPDRPLRFLAEELQRERSVQAMKALKDLHVDDHLRLEDELSGQVVRFRERVRGPGRAGLELLAGSGLAEGDLFQGGRGLHGHLRKLAGYDGVAIGTNSYVRKMLDGGKWASGKASEQTRHAIEMVRPRLEELCLQAEDLLAEGLRKDLLRRAILRELLATASLQELDRHLRSEKRDEGVTFFSDLTRRAAELVAQEPVPFIHERMGERYRHYLIDEFQDTSLMQWHGLLPLVENALASGGSAFLVGDGKQAIYRWRNGEVRQFLELPAVFGSEGLADPVTIAGTLQRNFIERAPLHDNYRSGRAIIAFNNELFGHLGQRLNDPGLRKVYDGLAQEGGRTSEGHVRLELLADQQDTGAPEHGPGEDRLARMTSMVREALDEGHAAGDIAVLVRTGAQGRQVAHRLLLEGIPIVSPDALKLGGDPAVEYVLDVLRCLNTKNEEAATRALQHLAMLGSPPDQDLVEPFPEPLMAEPYANVARALRDHRIDTSSSAPAELIHRILGAIGIDPAGDAYCVALLDEAHAYTLRHGVDLTGFLAHWDRTGNARSIQPPEHGRAVQVMTIHRSKGLQFPVVIVPWTDMGGSRQQGTLWVEPGEAAPDLPLALVRASAGLRDVGVPEVLVEEDLKELDELDLLYVAFTRAEDRLRALVGPKESGLLEALPDLKEQGFHERGSAAPVEAQHAPEPPTGWSTGDQGELRDRLATRKEAPDGWRAWDPDPFRTHGTLVHEVLAEVRTPGDLVHVLDRAVRQGRASKAVRDLLLEQLTPQLSSDALVPYFGEGLDVRTEVPLIASDGSALRPDRVVLSDDLTRVLDIKTGVPHERHAEQVGNYVRSLKEAGEPRVQGALWYVRSGEVVPIGS